MMMAHPHVQDWLRLIRAEFDEMPDLQLTERQVESLWGLDPTVAEAILDALVSAGFLRRTRRGVYMRNGGR
jgi:predicted transcriptional regulator of viral defense system